MITGLREPMRFRVYDANRGIVNVEGTRGVPPATPAAIWSGSGSCSSLEANTYITPRTDGDIVERGIELAMIAMAPFVCNAVGGMEHDLRLLADLAEKGIQLQEVKRRLEELIRTDRHHDLRTKFADALTSSLEIDRDEIADIIK